MKPFNLERALAGDPVVTRDGRKVKIAGYKQDAELGKQLVGWIEGDARCWDSYGRVYYDVETKENPELVMAPKKREGWVNVIDDGPGSRAVQYGRIFDEEKRAKEHCDTATGMKTVRIEWEE